MNYNCVLAAVGKSSLHQEWIDDNSKFDLHLIVYDDSYTIFKNDSQFVTAKKGFKFPLIYDYLYQNPKLLDRYNYFYMPDDDISINSHSIQKLFRCMDKYQLVLAQPAINNSFYSFPHTTRHNDSILRYTSFVEIMQPCFSREALKNVLFTFNNSISGWGLDYHWGIILDYKQMNMAIIDSIGSKHTRPVTSNHFEELKAYVAKNNLCYDIYCTK